MHMHMHMHMLMLMRIRNVIDKMCKRINFLNGLCE